MVNSTARMDESRSRLTPVSLLVGLAAALIAYNTAAPALPGFETLYVPFSLVVTTALIAVARVGRLSALDLGLSRSTVRSGLRGGGATVFVVGLGIAIASAVPWARPLFLDERVAGLSVAALVYQAVVRIPFGTVLLEEVAFRGVLLGLWSRRSEPLRAAIGSSIVFGAWHIRPALEAIGVNDLGGSLLERGLLVLGAVAGTTVAGLVFAALRIRSGSLLAPMLAHVATNSLAIVAAFFVRSL